MLLIYLTQQFSVLHFIKNKKKKAACIKATKVTVMLVKSNANSIPRGKHCKALLENKSIEKLEIYRTVSTADVRDAILGAFQHQNLKHFVYLYVDPTNRFTLDSVQNKDGNCTADAGGKATVYIKESMHVRKLNYHPTCHYGYVQEKPVCSDTSNDDTELPAVPLWLLLLLLLPRNLVQLFYLMIQKQLLMIRYQLLLYMYTAYTVHSSV